LVPTYERLMGFDRLVVDWVLLSMEADRRAAGW
jgi:hypothetical protein